MPTRRPPSPESAFWITPDEIVFGGCGQKSLLMILRSAATLARHAAIVALAERGVEVTLRAVVEELERLLELARTDATPHRSGQGEYIPDVVVAVTVEHVTVAVSPMATGAEIQRVAAFFLRLAYGLAIEGRAVLSPREYETVMRVLAIDATYDEETRK